mmetsp:Transcript_1438/g.3459  ORF Transcript_1438/g.3459 Transcript_1438/m.3459 type:complete len:286 (+) Transcript_1438:1165-2022(+)
MLHNHFRSPRLSLPLQQGIAAACHDSLFRLHGASCWLRLCNLLQDVQGSGDGSAEEHRAHRHAFPWCCFPHLLWAKSHDLGRPGHWGGSLWNSSCLASLLVCAVPSARLLGKLPRVQEGSGRAPSPHKRHPAADPRTGLVYAVCALSPDGWGPPLRSRLRRALLHPLLHMAAQVLLPLWVHASCAADPHSHVCRDHHSHVLLPALQRGLSLVVAFIRVFWVLLLLPLCLLSLLCQVQASDGKGRRGGSLRWIHAHRVLLNVSHHGVHRLPRRLLVRPQDLRCCQD